MYWRGATITTQLPGTLVARLLHHAAQAGSDGASSPASKSDEITAFTFPGESFLSGLNKEINLSHTSPGLEIR